MIGLTHEVSQRCPASFRQGCEFRPEVWAHQSQGSLKGQCEVTGQKGAWTGPVTGTGAQLQVWGRFLLLESCWCFGVLGWGWEGEAGWLPGVTWTPNRMHQTLAPTRLAFKVRNSIPGRLCWLAGLAPTKAALTLTCSLTESGVPPAWPAARA